MLTLLLLLQTQNDKRDDDERDDDERDEQDEREEVPDELVRVRAQELRDKEIKRPSTRSQELKASRTQTRQELCHLRRYTDEMRETSKASETKHEASGCACEPHELPAPRTANPRDRETESRTKNPSTRTQ